MSMDAFIKECESHVGYREGTTTMFGRWYGNKVGDSGFDSAPWCDMFLGYCADRVDEMSAVGVFAYTPYHVGYFKAKKQWHSGTDGIKRGDIAFFNWDGGEVDHVGVVTGVSGDVVKTVEGNTGDACQRKERKKSAGIFAGYGRPPYGSNAPHTPAPTPRPGVPIAHLLVDGEPDRLTWRAIQRILNYRTPAGLDVDGIPGPLTWKAFQRALNEGKL